MTGSRPRINSNPYRQTTTKAELPRKDTTSFGSSAIFNREIRGFPSQPHDRFGFFGINHFFLISLYPDFLSRQVAPVIDWKEGQVQDLFKSNPQLNLKPFFSKKRGGGPIELRSRQDQLFKCDPIEKAQANPSAPIDHCFPWKKLIILLSGN